ncbi:hypothetical protein D3C72_2096200 [compost metagenome]
MHVLDLGQLEHQRRRDMRLLGPGLAAEEQARLAVVVGKALGADAALVALLRHLRAAEAEVGGLAR